VTSDQYLAMLLVGQDLTGAEEASLRSLRDRIEAQLRELPGEPRVYYGGSFAKNTMIRSAYDLDVVAYWPSESTFTVQGISDGVGKHLQKYWEYVIAKSVSWQLPFEGGFHIDVVSGRAIDSSFANANLWRRDRATTLKTSIKKHIKAVRDSGRRDAIRLMKLWKLRAGLRCKTLWLELMVMDACLGCRGGLEQQVLASLGYLRDHALGARVIDPANSHNVISDDVTAQQKLLVAREAQAALDARTWQEVFRE
jgi:hypothetical protein